MPFPPSRRPALVLALMTPCLTELFSGNVPAPKFFFPPIFLLLVISYGLPVLLIRDLWVRWKLSLPGLFLLGLGYGIYNEGVLAKTLLRSNGVPIDAFDHYSFLGLNWPWAFLIVPWHALHAVVFPIAIITWLYPDARSFEWFSRREFALGSIFAVVFGSFIFLVNKSFIVPSGYLLFFLALIAVLIFLSKRVSRKIPFLGEGGCPARAPVATGFIFYPLFIIGLSLLAGCKLPGLIICAVSLLFLGGSYRFIVKQGWLPLSTFILLVFGDYLSGSIFTLLVTFHRGGLFGAIAGLTLIILFSRGIFVALKPGSVEAAA